MALGAITVLEKNQIVGPLNIDRIQFNGDSTYPTGGTAGFQTTLRAALGKGNVQILYITTIEGGGFNLVYDGTNDKLKVNSGASEHAAGDISATPFRALVISK